MPNEEISEEGKKEATKEVDVAVHEKDVEATGYLEKIRRYAAGIEIKHYVAMMFVVAPALLLFGLSFHGGWDDFAHAHISETINESLVMFLSVVGIDVAVSFLKGFPLVGGLLDPLNDVIEGLLQVMIVATGSLFLQRIIIEIAASVVFKWGFFLIGLVAMSATLLHMYRNNVRNAISEPFGVSREGIDATIARIRNFSIRVFIIATILRFVGPAVVTLSFLVSQAFLETEISKHKESLSSFNARLSSVSDQVSDASSNVFDNPDLGEPEGLDARESVDTDDPDDDLDEQRKQLAEQKSRKESELAALELSLSKYQQESENLKEEIESYKDEVGLVDRFVPKRLRDAVPGGRTESEETRPEEARAEFESAKARREEVDREMKRMEKRIGDVERERDDLQKSWSTHQQELEKLKEEIESYKDEVGLVGRFVPKRLRDAVPGERTESEETRREEARGELESAKTRLEEVDREMKGIAERIDDAEEELDGLRESLSMHRQESGDLDEIIASYDEAELSGRVLPGAKQRDGTPGEESVSAEARREEFELAKARSKEVGREMKRIEKQIDGVGEQIGDIEERIECVDRRMGGEACETSLPGMILASTGEMVERVGGMVESANEKLSAVGKRLSRAGKSIKDSISTLVKNAPQMMSDLIKLMVLITLEHLVLPIVFLVIALKYSLPVVLYATRSFSRTVQQTTSEARGIANEVQKLGTELKQLKNAAVTDRAGSEGGEGGGEREGGRLPART